MAKIQATADLMKRATARSLKAERFDRARWVITFVAAIAFFLQSFVTQTHIHPGQVQTVAGISQAIGHSPAKSPFEKTDCPLCQAVVHAGSFVTPSAPVIFLTFTWVSTTLNTVIAPATSGDVSHSWQSRAPPSR